MHVLWQDTNVLRNILVKEGKRTIGEADILAARRFPRVALHIESTVKFYFCAMGGSADHDLWRGARGYDRLAKKWNAMRVKQMRLFTAHKKSLPRDFASLPVHSRVMFRGGFYSYGGDERVILPEFSRYPDALIGLWRPCDELDDHIKKEAAERKELRFTFVERSEATAPVKRRAEDTFDACAFTRLFHRRIEEGGDGSVIGAALLPAERIADGYDEHHRIAVLLRPPF